jgi:hypothetical protein
MTDLADRPVVDVGLAARRAVDEPTSRPPSEPVELPGRVALATLCAAAGLIHLVMVPAHTQEATIEGVQFALAGWVQIVLAVWLAVRPTRAALLTTIALNAVFVGAWIMSRVWGLPYGAHPWEEETASFADVATVGFEIALIVVAVLLLWRPGLTSGWSESQRVLGSAVPVAIVAITTAALMAPSTASHAHGAGEVAGHTHGSATAEVDAGFAALVNGQDNEGMAHAHGPDEPLTADLQAQLDEELSWNQTLQDRYPTLASAKAAGYTEAGPFAPGLGLHLMPPIARLAAGAGDGVLDTPAEVESAFLIYDGIEADSQLAGFMYISYGSLTQPEGFAGPNDHWHFHTNTCVVNKNGKTESPLGADRSATKEQCDRFGGTLIENTGYMVHVWNVPGYENPDGLFGNLTPKITCPDGSYSMIPDEEIGFVRTLCPV